MPMNCKHDFVMTEEYNAYVKEQIEPRIDFLLAPDGTPISKEYPEKESGPKLYNKVWKRKPQRDNIHPYMPVMVELCKKYSPNIKDVLEVGAGFGNLAIMVIEALDLSSYTAYEFSKAYKSIEERFEKVPIETHVISESFRECSNLERFDCVIATEVFEHIYWDIEFILKIPKDTHLYFSVPAKHAKDHVRAFLLPDSIWARYHDLLEIYEIRTVCLHENFPKWWCVAAHKL